MTDEIHIKDQIPDLHRAAESWNPQHVLAWAFQSFGVKVAISSAFGAEGMVLIDMASRVQKNFGSSPWTPSSSFPRPIT